MSPYHPRLLSYPAAMPAAPNIPLGLRSVGRDELLKGVSIVSCHKNFTQLFWSVAGEGSFLREGRWYEQTPGSIFCYEPDSIHELIVKSDKWCYYWISFDHKHALNWLRDFDFTRMDTVDRFVCIVYLYASGAGPEPYTEDITEWNRLRQIPYMATYFDHMNLLHISYAAFNNKIDAGKDSAYIRARRYPRSLFGGQFDRMELEPDYTAIDLFEPGMEHHMTIIKRGEEMYMNVSNINEERLYYWDLSQVPGLQKGRIGLRHMWQRAGLYKNITVSQLENRKSESC
ncbi:MAG TPA: hypothetical protein DEA90_15765 [Opitutae bacterium]|nr:hypothetical protein [Puniceicoccaceae bacterium]HBR95616.1 hypothetical protein [Opitutae bacterium]